MTVTEAPALYEAAFRGEPLQRTVFPEPLNTPRLRSGRSETGRSVCPTGVSCHPAAPADHRETRERTGWSARRLAEIVGSTPHDDPQCRERTATGERPQRRPSPAARRGPRPHRARLSSSSTATPSRPATSSPPHRPDGAARSRSAGDRRSGPGLPCRPRCHPTPPHWAPGRRPTPAGWPHDGPPRLGRMVNGIAVRGRLAPGIDRRVSTCPWMPSLSGHRASLSDRRAPTVSGLVRHPRLRPGPRRTDDPDPGIELRPLFTLAPPPDWGIRSAQLRLTDDEYADASAPHLTVAPHVLTTILAPVQLDATSPPPGVTPSPPGSGSGTTARRSPINWCRSLGASAARWPGTAP